MALPSFSEARNYLEDPHACFQLTTLTKHVNLSPKYTRNLTEGICEMLNDEMSQYSDGVEAVMIAYDNIQILQSGAIIFEELPQLHFSIKVDVIIFKPTIGSVLRGIVNKLGEQHIGCLVHNCFNASISKPVDVEMSDWEGFKLDLGEKFFFQVTDVSGQNGLIFIRGTLPEGSLSKFGKRKKRKHDGSSDVTDNEVQSVSKKRKKNRSIIVSEPISDSADHTSYRESDSCMSDTSPEKKKSIKRKPAKVQKSTNAVKCEASQLSAGLPTEHNNSMAYSDSGVSSLFSSYNTAVNKLTEATAETGQNVVTMDGHAIARTSSEERHKKRKKNKTQHSVVTSESGMDDIQQIKSESGLNKEIKLEPNDDFTEDTPTKHKKHKKSINILKQSSCSDGSVTDSSKQRSKNHETGPLMVDIKLEVMDEAMCDTPRKHKKRKSSGKDLHQSSIRELDRMNDSDHSDKQSEFVMACVKQEPTEDVLKSHHKKHKKKKKSLPDTFLSTSQNQTKRFKQLEFL